MACTGRIGIRVLEAPEAARLVGCCQVKVAILCKAAVNKVSTRVREHSLSMQGGQKNWSTRSATNSGISTHCIWYHSSHLN